MVQLSSESDNENLAEGLQPSADNQNPTKVLWLLQTVLAKLDGPGKDSIAPTVNFEYLTDHAAINSTSKLSKLKL